MGDMPKGASPIPKGEEWEWFVGAICFMGALFVFMGIVSFMLAGTYKLIFGVWP